MLTENVIAKEPNRLGQSITISPRISPRYSGLKALKFDKQSPQREFTASEVGKIDDSQSNLSSFIRHPIFSCIERRGSPQIEEQKQTIRIKTRIRPKSSAIMNTRVNNQRRNKPIIPQVEVEQPQQKLVPNFHPVNIDLLTRAGFN